MARPYLCPVCIGKGTVPVGFYGHGDATSNCKPETCRSCQGAGVLWDYSPQLPEGPFWIGPVTCNDIQKTIPPQGTVVTAKFGGPDGVQG